MRENGKTLSWKARLCGGVFCAPACGRGCTKAEYDEACRRARALARVLGRGWKPRVWENLGWHYNAVRGTLKVSPDGGSGYIAFLGEEASPGGYWTGQGQTPRAAAQEATREGRRFVDSHGQLVRKAEEAMKP